ncbi:unnamed protein product [Prunus armeniaca]|uniref:Secreted protein n=1 Tax=Prunus armeniaca TaxID=36596 RepID=A0A6J5Y051_PRUAR|nr:unnamed protein product [Prunus armeniaca]
MAVATLVGLMLLVMFDGSCEVLVRRWRQCWTGDDNSGGDSRSDDVGHVVDKAVRMLRWLVRRTRIAHFI